jgi:hypothetical protein
MSCCCEYFITVKCVLCSRGVMTERHVKVMCTARSCRNTELHTVKVMCTARSCRNTELHIVKVMCTARSCHNTELHTVNRYWVLRS